MRFHLDNFTLPTCPYDTSSSLSLLIIFIIILQFCSVRPSPTSKVCQLIHRACLRACRRTEWGQWDCNKKNLNWLQNRTGYQMKLYGFIMFLSHSVNNSTIIEYVLFSKATTSLKARDCLSCTTDPCMFILFQDFARLRVVSLTSSLTSRRAEERVSTH